MCMRDYIYSFVVVPSLYRIGSYWYNYRPTDQDRSLLFSSECRWVVLAIEHDRISTATNK
jgi:hypothetical protein